MRQIQYGRTSPYAEDASIKVALAEAEAQLETLRSLGDAIEQERQSLDRTLEIFAATETKINWC
jgi:hypothetical protein